MSTTAAIALVIALPLHPLAWICFGAFVLLAGWLLYKLWKFSAALTVAVVFIQLLSLASIILFPFGGFVLLAVPSMLLFLLLLLLPSVFNLLLSWLAALYLPIKVQWRFVFILPFSFLLGLNVRLPLALNLEQAESVNEPKKGQIILAPEEHLSVETNVDKWSVRKSPYDTISIGGDPPPMGLHGPMRYPESLEMTLARAGIPYQIGGTSLKRLIVHATESQGVGHWSAEVTEAGQVVSSIEAMRRDHYPLEPEADPRGFAARVPFEDYGVKVAYLLQANFWTVSFDLAWQAQRPWDPPYYGTGTPPYQILASFVKRSIVYKAPEIPEYRTDSRKLRDIELPPRDTRALPGSCPPGEGGRSNDRSHVFSDGNQIKFQAEGRITFQTRDGVRRSLVVPWLNEAGSICKPDGVILQGRDDKGGFVFTWFETRGFASKKWGFPLQEYKVDVGVRHVELQGECLMVNLIGFVGASVPTRKARSAEYLVCPASQS